MPSEPSSNIAFTPTVKAIQTRRGSRAAYARMEEQGGWRTRVTPELAAFLEERDSAYLGTANRDGQPYIQHRGGPKGFIRVLNDTTLGFADFAGNRQYISTGNLTENPRAFLFLMDYANRRRIKIWGRARVVSANAKIAADLMPPDYRARQQQAIIFKIKAWDVNCPQHIPQKFDAADVESAVQRLQFRIQELEAENAALRSGLIQTR
jgi:predicted pyridoxine 5'-phosphate oxidase superfamily flavin-nucleotide-binding protein